MFIGTGNIMSCIMKWLNSMVLFFKKLLQIRKGFKNIIHVISQEIKDEFFRKSFIANSLLALILAKLIYSKLTPMVMVQYMSTLSVSAIRLSKIKSCY